MGPLDDKGGCQDLERYPVPYLTELPELAYEQRQRMTHRLAGVRQAVNDPPGPF